MRRTASLTEPQAFSSILGFAARPSAAETARVVVDLPSEPTTATTCVRRANVRR